MSVTPDEVAQCGLLEILNILVTDGKYTDHGHLLETLKEAGFSAEDILKGGQG